MCYHAARMIERFLGENRRLIPIVSVLLAVGFLATSLASYFTSRSSVRTSIIESGLPLTSDNIYSEIQNDLVRPIFISSMIANDTFLRDWVLAGERDPAQIAKYLNEIRDKYDTVSSFFVSERTRNYYYGEGVLKQVREDEPRDVWYFRVRQMKEPYEINVDPDLANNDAMTIFINYRLVDYKGGYIGVAGVGLTMMSLRQQVDSYRARFHRDVYFVDGAGKVILAGDSPAGRIASIQDMPGLGALASGILGGNDGSFEYDRNGRTVLLNTRFIPELGWRVFVEQDETEATAGIRNALIANLLICLVITLVVVAATSYTINRFQSRIAQMAITDKLTGLLNRHGFEAVCGQAVREAVRARQPLSMILFDVDQFKEINDKYGHAAGDLALVQVGRAARETLRVSDAICRWGGDEFLVLLKNCNMSDALKLAGKIADRITGCRVAHGDQSISMTVSLGVAERRSAEEADKLIDRADAALYDAKSQGRRRVSQAI